MRGEPERGARRHKPPPRLRQSPPPANLAGAGSTLANADGKPDSANISEFRAARSERAPQQANPHTRARPRKPTTHAQACAHAHAHKHMQACTHANRYFSSSVLLCFASQLQVPLFLDIPSPAVLDHRRMQRALGKPPRENELLYEPATQPQVLAELLDVGGISVELAPKWSSSYAANSHLRLWGEPACVTSPRWPCPRPRRHGGCAPRWTAPPPPPAEGSTRRSTTTRSLSLVIHADFVPPPCMAQEGCMACCGVRASHRKKRAVARKGLRWSKRLRQKRLRPLSSRKRLRQRRHLWRLPQAAPRDPLPNT